MGSRPFLIWSCRDQAWLRRNAWGHSACIAGAGVFHRSFVDGTRHHAVYFEGANVEIAIEIDAHRRAIASLERLRESLTAPEIPAVVNA